MVFYVLALLCFSWLCVAAEVNAKDLEPAPVVHQLRIYELEPENAPFFHDRFRDHAARIMGNYGFNIIAMWEARRDDRVEFVYLLEWPDEETMKNAWDAFMADEEWTAIKRQTSAKHGVFVRHIEDRPLYITDYSPDALWAGAGAAE